MSLRRRVAGLGCLAALAASCSKGSPAVAPRAAAPANARAVPAGSVAAEQLVAAVLDECHRPLRLRMQRVKASVTLPSGARWLVQADLPHRARTRKGRQEWLANGGRVTSLEGDEAASEAAGRTLDLTVLVDVAAFGPLHRATGCSEEGDAFHLAQPDGDAVRLALHPDTLLPSSMRVRGDLIAVEDYLRTPSSWVARRLRHPRLGVCEVVFEDGGIQFPDGYFDPEREDKGQQPVIRQPIPGAVVETQSPTPIVVDGKATQLVVLPDPGDWQDRYAPYREVIDELQLQNQRIAGFPCLFVDEDRRGLMAAPFRQRKGQPPFDPPSDFLLSDVPAGKLLVVYPPDGDVEARIEAGRQLLERELANRRLTAKGPMIAQPFVHLDAAPPEAAELVDVAVRVWVRIE